MKSRLRKDQPQTRIPKGWPNAHPNLVTIVDVEIGATRILCGLCHGGIENDEPVYYSDYGRVVMDRMAEILKDVENPGVIFAEIKSPKRALLRVAEAITKAVVMRAAVLFLCKDDPTKGAALLALNITEDES